MSNWHACVHPCTPGGPTHAASLPPPRICVWRPCAVHLFPCFTMFDIVQDLRMQQSCSGALQQSAAQQQETGWCRLAASKRQALTPMVLQVVPDSQRSEVPFRFVQFGSVNTRNGASLIRLQDGGGFAAGFPCCTAVAINPDPVCSPQTCCYLAAHLISDVSTHDAALNHLPTNSTVPNGVVG